MTEHGTITVSEYIAEQDRLEKEAKELFPKKFDICSNSMGYIRQPVYACLTCNPNPSEEAGFCYSCSISCHGDHNLVELFTKRGFRCDCGTTKFKETKCKLDQKPEGAVNELNQYNHNYLGRFCWCDVQYDPHKEESTMLQCVVCEDWFHDTCIGINPHNDDFDDFICRTCTRAHPFLRRYAHNALFMIGLSEKGGEPKSVVMVDCSKDKDENGKGKEVKRTEEKVENVEVDVVAIGEATYNQEVPNGAAASNTMTTTTTTTTTTTATATTATVVTTEPGPSEQKTEQGEMGTQMKRALATTAEDSADEQCESSLNKKAKLDIESSICKLQDQPVDMYPDQEMSLFVTEGWRDLFCQCSSCMAMYTKESIAFILAEEPIYEDEDDDEANTSVLETGMKKLSEMDRVQAMDGVLAYSKMRDEIRKFLEPFSKEDKIVTNGDIEAFFKEKMEQRAALGRRPNFS